MADNVAPQTPRIPSPPLHKEADKAIHDKAAQSDGNKKIIHTNQLAVQSSLSADQTGALKVHNDGRKGKGLEPLTWDDTLTKDAQAWADHLKQIDQMVHSTGDQRPGEGENLAWAWASNGIQNPLTGGAQMWMNEAKDYHGEAIGQGDFSKYGHYTQCMWKSTTKVGMASATTSKGAVYTVGRYSAPGNWSGQKPY